MPTLSELLVKSGLDKNRIIEDLPESLRLLAGSLPIDSAIVLIEQFGGTTLYVPTPESVHENHPLALKIGYSQAKQLAQLCAKEHLLIPNCAKLQRKMQARIALIMRSRGETRSAIARELRITERTAQKYLKQARQQSIHPTKPEAP
jgi:hypothetical protein